MKSPQELDLGRRYLEFLDWPEVCVGAAPARSLHDGRRRGRLSQLPQVNGARLVRGAKLDLDELRDLL